MNQNTRGFTLVEIMIAVMIVGILAAIAIPTYSKYRIRENRNEVKSAMLQTAQRLSEYKLANNNYNTTLLKIRGSTTYPSTGTSAKLYNLQLVTTANTWIMYAFPIGKQAKDGSLALTDQGWTCWVKGQDSACAPSATTKWDGN